ncbi:hypothetical protein FKM82_003331 [Ascaphus truei]
MLNTFTAYGSVNMSGLWTWCALHHYGNAFFRSTGEALPCCFHGSHNWVVNRLMTIYKAAIIQNNKKHYHLITRSACDTIKAIKRSKHRSLRTIAAYNRTI